DPQLQVRMLLAHRYGVVYALLTRGVGELAPDGVDSGFVIRPAAPDRLFHAAADGSVGVGPRNDHEIGVEPVTRVEGRPVLPERFLEAHDRLAGDVATALRESLVFQMDARDARLDELRHGPDRGERVTVAVVGVRDD